MTQVSKASEGLRYSEYLSKYKELYSKKSLEDLRALAHIKRFVERFSGDSEFRNGILSGIIDITKGAQSIGCDTSTADFETLRPLYHPDYLSERKPELLVKWPAARLWDQYMSELIAIRGDMLKVADTGGYNYAFDLWRNRQINRASLDLGLGGLGNVHPPIAFEVSSGCTVGCWFCGISAEKFRGHFELSGDGADQWRTVLAEVKSVMGDGLNSGFLYWATEPLDHPQYLDILDIFYEFTQVYPQTTSAIPLRDIEMTRGVISRWAEGGGYPNRFSILNTKTLRGVHEEFTPEELLAVELVMQNSGNAANTKTDAGKAMVIPIKEAAPAPVKKGFAMAQGTIACVSGFLVNIVEKTVRLVSPCMPTKEIPDGYIVFASAKYEQASDLGTVMRKIIEDHMAVHLDPSSIVKFSHNLTYELGENGSAVKGSAAKFEAPMIELFGKYMSDGPISAKGLLKAAISDGKDPFQVVNAMEKARRAGIIDSEVSIEAV